MSEARRLLLVAVGAGEVSGFRINGRVREVWVVRDAIETRVVTARVAGLAESGLIVRLPDPAGSASRWGWRLTTAGRAALRALR